MSHCLTFSSSGVLAATSSHPAPTAAIKVGHIEIERFRVTGGGMISITSGISDDAARADVDEDIVL